MTSQKHEQADRAKFRNRGDKNVKSLQQLRSFLLAIAMSLTAAVGAQEARSVSLSDQFALFTQCSRMNTLVDVQRSNSTPTQSIPTEDAVRRAVTSRLRSARLFDDMADTAYLYVHITPVMDKVRRSMGWSP